MQTILQVVLGVFLFGLVLVAVLKYALRQPAKRPWLPDAIEQPDYQRNDGNFGT